MENLALQHLEESEFPKDYKQSLNALLPVIERNLNGNLHFGPTYNVETSQGKPLRVLTLIADQSMTPERVVDTAPSRQYILLAVDENDNIVGYESCDLYSRQADYMVTNFITTGYRGIGLSTPIEMAFVDIMERESTRLGKNIEWYVSNESDKANQKMQTRWQAHYGLSGSVFGTSPKARPREKTRTFSPASVPLLTLEEVETCDLTRTKGPEQELQIERTSETQPLSPQTSSYQKQQQLEIFIANTRDLL